MSVRHDDFLNIKTNKLKRLRDIMVSPEAVEYMADAEIE